jgi:hypothetical protein
MLAMQDVCLFRFLVLCVSSVLAAPAAATPRVWSLCLQSVAARCSNVLCAHGSYCCTVTVNGRFGGFWRRGNAAVLASPSSCLYDALPLGCGTPCMY